MKPTRGRVSLAPAGEGWLGLTVLGALARTVADSALMLDVMQGALPGDPTPAPPMRGTFREAAAREPGRAAHRHFAHESRPVSIARLSADQRLAFERVARLLAELGHDVSERHPRYGAASLEITQTYLRGIYESSLELPDASLAERYTRQMAAAGRVLVPASPPRRAPAPGAGGPRRGSWRCGTRSTSC